MATTVTKIIDPNNGSGTDYTSLSAWEAAQQGDLTGVRDEIAVAKCRCTGGTADGTAVTLDGWTTSESQYIKIWTDPSESYRHSGKDGTGNIYRIDRSSEEDEWDSYCIWVREKDVKIAGMLIKPRSMAIALTDDLAWNVEISYCVMRGKNLNESYKYGIAEQGAASGAVIKIWNCIAYDFGGTTGEYSSGFAFEKEEETKTVHLYNCTAHNCRYGFSRSVYGTIHIKNCLAASCADGFYTNWLWDTNSSVCSNNASSLASDAPGSGSRNSQTFTFVNEAGDDFHLASTDAGAKDHGTSDPGSGLFSDDIDGSTRSGSWDIGADEYVAAASTRVPFRRLNILLRLCLSMFNLIWRCFK